MRTLADEDLRRITGAFHLPGCDKDAALSIRGSGDGGAYWATGTGAKGIEGKQWFARLGASDNQARRLHRFDAVVVDDRGIGWIGSEAVKTAAGRDGAGMIGDCSISQTDDQAIILMVARNGQASRSEQYRRGRGRRTRHDPLAAAPRIPEPHRPEHPPSASRTGPAGRAGRAEEPGEFKAAKTENDWRSCWRLCVAVLGQSRPLGGRPERHRALYRAEHNASANIVPSWGGLSVPAPDVVPNTLPRSSPTRVSPASA